MPYLKNDFKSEIEKVEGMENQCDYASSLSLKNFAGYLNYKVFKLVKSYIKVNGKSYFTFAVVLGTLLCSLLEVWRRFLVGYEEEKIKSNGDV